MIRICFAFLLLWLAIPLAYAETPVDLLFDEQDTEMTATESKRALGQAPAIVTVITEKQIRDMGAHTLIEALESVPGFNVSFPSGLASGQTLTVRGLKSSEAEKTLLMINGHRVNNPYSGSWTFLFDEFPLDDVRRIEIIRGPGSALYGSNAMAAVIHIITRGAEDFRGSEASVSTGNHGAIAGHISTGGIGDHASIMLSLNAASTDGDSQAILRDAAGKSGTSNFWRRQQQGFLSAKAGNWSLFAMHVNKRRGSLLDATNRIDHASNVRIRQSIAALSWVRNGDLWDVSLRTDADLFELDPQWQLFGGAQILRAPVKNLTLTGSGLVRYRGWQDHEWTLNASYDHIRQFDVRKFVNGADLTALSNHNRDTTRQVWALAIQDQWSPLANLTLTAGVRMEHYSDVSSHTSPRFALVWHATEMLDIKAMYGHAFRAPNFIELFSANNPSVLGNPNVKPESVNTYELGASLHKGIWHLNGNVYYSRYKNLITRIAPSPLTINIGRETLKGFETELRVDVQKGLYGALSYTWQTGSSNLTAARLPDVARQVIRLSGDAPLPLDTHLHMDVHWIGSQGRAAGDPRPALASTWQADLAMRAGNVSSGPSMSFDIKNIFNHKIYSPVASPTMSDLPFHDREWMLNLAWTF